MMLAKVTGGATAFKLIGLDLPELEFALPGQPAATSIATSPWAEFLDDPFAQWPRAYALLGRDLVAHLEGVCGPGAAANHHRHALAAQRGFAALHASDVPDAVRDTYRERMLRAGLALPYFIWPNLDPFKLPRLADAVPEPSAARELARHGRLGEQRRCVAAARESHSGVFGDDPLRLHAFELRFLARRRAPEWWLIDLARDDGRLIQPVDYHRIAVEDRLYVPEQYTDLFVSRGWRL
jgi:hypothetical protein